MLALQSRIKIVDQARIKFPPVDLGPQDRKLLDAVELIVPTAYVGKQLSAEWQARSIHVSGVTSGNLVIVVADEPVRPMSCSYKPNSKPK
jgi:hypothetical protein